MKNARSAIMRDCDFADTTGFHLLHVATALDSAAPEEETTDCVCLCGRVTAPHSRLAPEPVAMGHGLVLHDINDQSP